MVLTAALSSVPPHIHPPIAQVPRPIREAFTGTPGILMVSMEIISAFVLLSVEPLAPGLNAQADLFDRDLRVFAWADGIGHLDHAHLAGRDGETFGRIRARYNCGRGDVSNRLLNSLGCGSAPEGKSECHQNPAGSKMQSCHLVEAGDAIDPGQGLLQPLHHDGRDRLASDQAARLVGEYEGDGRK